MGFLDRLFGKKEEKPEPPRKIPLEDLEQWLQEKIKQREEEAAEKLAPLVEEVFNARDEAREVVKDLGEYEFPPELKKRVYKPVLTSKPVYVKAMLDALQSIAPREPEDYAALKEFHTAMLRGMKTIQKVQLGKGRYLTVTFREEMLKIGGALNSILDALKEIGGEIEETEKETSRLRSLIARSRELKEKLKLLDTSPPREEEELERQKQNLEEKYRRLLESRAYREHVELRERLHELREERSNLQMKVINSLGPLQRSFRKFKKLVAEGVVNYRDHAILEGYLRSPAEAFALEGEGCRGIRRLLQGLQEAVESGTLKLRRKERRKVLSKIRDGMKELPKLLSSLRKLEEDISKAELKLRGSPVAREEEALQRELSALRHKLRRLGEMRKAKVEAEAKLRAEARELAGRLQREVEELSGRKISIALGES